MNKSNLLVLVGLLLTTSVFSQLPPGYALIKGESPVGRENYYTNGRIKIFHDVVQEFGDGGAADWIKGSYQGFTTIKTKDGLVVGIGNQKGTNIYIVFKGQHYYILTSEFDSKEFSDMSTYVLKKVRQLGKSFL